MLRLIMAGLRARLAPAVALVLLAALASGAAAVAPGYLVAALDRTVDAAVRTATLDQGVISAATVLRPTDDPRAALETPAATVRRALARPGLTFVSGWAMDGVVGRSADAAAGGPGAPAGPPAPATLIYREGMCEHLVVTGACPGAP